MASGCNRESPSRRSLQLVNYVLFFRRVETAGGVDSDIGKTRKVQLIEHLHQGLQLREAKSRQLQAGRGQSSQHGQGPTEVAAGQGAS